MSSSNVYALPGMEEKPAPKPKRKAKTDPPDEILISEDMRAWFQAKRIPGSAEDLMEEMLDWHRANGERKVDWIATWRNWCKNHQRFTAQSERRGVTKEQATVHITDAYIDQHARPGESYEAARLRIMRDRRS